MATDITDKFSSDKARKIDAMRAMYLEFKGKVERLVLEKKQCREKTISDNKV